MKKNRSRERKYSNTDINSPTQGYIENQPYRLLLLKYTTHINTHALISTRNTHIRVRLWCDLYLDMHGPDCFT